MDSGIVPNMKCSLCKRIKKGDPTRREGTVLACGGKLEKIDPMYGAWRPSPNGRD
jgi:hypothetical protein